MSRFDRAIRIAQLAALLWIGYELHGISASMYTGPGPYDDDVTALKEIADHLKEIASSLQFKR
jgi:hypothetical protein